MGLSPNQVSLQRNPESSPEFQRPTAKLSCPRCNSTNTKFCYYNNYNKSQPRHFCKSCKRHWTEGGTLRKVPIGGGRKIKRLKPVKITSNNVLAKSYGSNNSLTNDGLVGDSTNAYISLPDKISINHDHELEFPCPSFGSLDENFPCSFSGLGYVYDLYCNGESSGLDASLNLNSINDQPLTTFMESTSNWVWDDIDKFVSSD